MPTNRERATAALSAYEAFPWRDNDPLTNIADLVGDLCHLADAVALRVEAGEGVVTSALNHYRNERTGADGLNDDDWGDYTCVHGHIHCSFSVGGPCARDQFGEEDAFDDEHLRLLIDSQREGG